MTSEQAAAVEACSREVAGADVRSAPILAYIPTDDIRALLSLIAAENRDLRARLTQLEAENAALTAKLATPPVQGEDATPFTDEERVRLVFAAAASKVHSRAFSREYIRGLYIEDIIERYDATVNALRARLAATEAENAELREKFAVSDSVVGLMGEQINDMTAENADLLVKLAGGDALHRAINTAREFVEAQTETYGDQPPFGQTAQWAAWEHLQRIVAAAPVSPRDV